MDRDEENPRDSGPRANQSHSRAVGTNSNILG